MELIDVISITNPGPTPNSRAEFPEKIKLVESTP
jgi:hypothetical protein